MSNNPANGFAMWSSLAAVLLTWIALYLSRLCMVTFTDKRADRTGSTPSRIGMPQHFEPIHPSLRRTILIYLAEHGPTPSSELDSKVCYSNLRMGPALLWLWVTAQINSFDTIDGQVFALRQVDAAPNIAS